MHFSRKMSALLGLVTLGLLTAAPALAQSVTTVSGHHDGNTTGTGDGYDANNGGTYIVTSTVASPTTFDNNFFRGLYANGSTVTVNGGAFNNNSFGLGANNSSTVTVNGGEFDNNKDFGLAASGSTVTVTGGEFNSNGVGLGAGPNSTVTITGGTFANNATGAYDLFAENSSTITLYGAFGGTQPTQTLGSGSGTFTGTLENDTLSQIFTYQNKGTITLVNGNAPVPNAVPEPSSIASFAIGGLGLLGLMLKAKKRRMA